jgi:hypothetical protein
MLSVFFTSCHPLFCVWEMGYNKTEKLNSADVIGKYVLTSYSKKMMQYEGRYQNITNSILEFKSDKTYRLTDAPDWLLNDFGNSNMAYFNKTGRWSFDCDEQGCILELEGLQTGELLFKKNAKFFILLGIGDPDSCQGMVYESINQH